MTTIYLVDIDGTVADNSHRRPLLQFECFSCLSHVQGKAQSTQEDFVCPHCGCCDGRPTSESWWRFNEPSQLLLDAPVVGSQKGIKALEAAGNPVHYLTARGLDQRDVTLEWLVCHFDFNVENHILVTREQDLYKEHDKSAVFKERALKQLTHQFNERYGDHRLVFIDDHLPNLKMFRRHGIALKSPEVWSALFT